MPPAEVILAIETSQRVGSVALDSGKGVHVESLRRESGHDEELMPAIDRLFQRAGLSPRELDAVGVSIGPGGFTGLRIAVATAKMLAMTLDAVIIAVPSALVAVMSTEGGGRQRSGSADDRGVTLVTLSAKRETFWGTLLRRKEDSWEIAGAGRLMEAETFPLDGVVEVLGDEYLPTAARKRCEEAGIPVRCPRFDASACLEAARWKLKAGERNDAWAMTPVYARPPEAVSLWRQRRR